MITATISHNMRGTRNRNIEDIPCRISKAPVSRSLTGYGARIPTKYEVQYLGRWRRVYCRIYSNAGTLFIGDKADYHGDGIIVDRINDGV